MNAFQPRVEGWHASPPRPAPPHAPRIQLREMEASTRSPRLLIIKISVRHTKSMTPAAKPRLAATTRVEARETQNTEAAPTLLAAPAPMTSANATPTSPDATIE